MQYTTSHFGYGHRGHPHCGSHEGDHGRFGGRHAGGRHGGGRFGGDSMGGGGPMRGRRRLFDAAELKLILLNLITESPRHGYDLIRAIETLSGGAYAPSPGVIYPMLTMLADMELVAEQPGEGSRKLFGITPAGSAYLEENRNEVVEALGRLDILAKRAERTDGAPIRRAMDNLKMALHNRLSGDNADAETVLNVAALLDEAAGKIERLK
ncbi:MAG: PadR family transcriptional regulator [Sphingobium sp.]|uniref:PadR family transcriptional regulator n=1 Tax=Sphingobium sp. TaxID=1912891 RepID=UPI0029A8B1A2|nr:PadR family transcriptional regulator [Sphingobium sp.]MDX3910289.1 PadR family transcriptional regulator [Sphingobium sp.]